MLSWETTCRFPLISCPKLDLPTLTLNPLKWSGHTHFLVAKFQTGWFLRLENDVSAPLQWVPHQCGDVQLWTGDQRELMGCFPAERPWNDP